MGNSSDADGQYPSSFYKSAEAPTEAIDYLVIKRSRTYHEGKKPSTFNFVESTGSGSGGLGDTGAAAYRANRGAIKKKRVDGVCYLAMPPQLSTQYQAGYKRMDIGVGGMAAMEALGNWGGGGDMGSLAKIVGDAAGAIAPEFATATLTNLITSFSGALGIGGQFDMNTFQQLQGGRVFNPFAEQTFNSMAFRTHSFNFKMLARSAKEAEMIYDIIKWVKMGAVPEVQKGTETTIKGMLGASIDMGSGYREGASKDDKKNIDAIRDKLTGTGKSQRWLKIPDFFDLRMIRADPNASTSWWKGEGGMKVTGDEPANVKDLHFKIHPSFCTGVGINYTPDGQYTSFKTIMGDKINVPAITLALQFTETRLINKQDIQDGF